MGAESHASRAITVRLSPTMHELLIEEARLEEVSASQFVREAVLLRCAWRRGRRDEPLMPFDDARTVRRVLVQLKSLLEEIAHD